jgi:hypothetical protein
MKAHGGIRGMAPLILSLGCKEVSGELYVTAALPPRENHGPRAGLDVSELSRFLAYTGIQSGR